MAVKGRVNVGESGTLKTSGSVSRGVTFAIRCRVNVGDSVPWSIISGSVSRGVILAVIGRVKVGDSVPLSTTSGSVSH